MFEVYSFFVTRLFSEHKIKLSVTISETTGNAKVEHQGEHIGAEKSQSAEHSTEKVKFCPILGLVSSRKTVRIVYVDSELLR